MESLLTALARRGGADYLEIRVEETRATRLEFRGPTLETVGQSVDYGGNVRALVGGGWGFVSFNRLDDLAGKVELAIRQARLTAASAGEPIRLAPVASVRDRVAARLREDPRQVSLEDKKDLLAGYNERVLGFGKGITSSSVRYFDRFSRLHLATSEGTYIEQERADVGGSITAIASRDGQTQQVNTPFGSSNDYGVVRGLEREIDDACATAAALLDAPVIPGGEYTVVLDPVLTGVFIHEAFGHLSEADGLYRNENLKQVMQLGRAFGRPILNVSDSGIDEGSRGYIKYDEEGVPAEQTYLIREGKLVGRLHSRETAGKMGERPTGSARAIGYRSPPIVRMRNTRIEPGESSFEDMLGDVKDGIYALGFYGGQTMGEMFTFTSMVAYRIRDGRIAELIRNPTLSGNVFATLHSIDMIGRDFHRRDDGGGCGKGGQSPLPVSHWAPPIRIQKCLVGGRG